MTTDHITATHAADITKSLLNANIDWRIRVARGEHTCTRCGETSTDGYCLRRDDDDHADGQYDLIPTTDYLQPQEYELT